MSTDIVADVHSPQCVTIGGGPGHDKCVCYCHHNLTSAETLRDDFISDVFGRTQSNSPVICARLDAIIAAARADRTTAADDPLLDGTDGAHPAWWRGDDHGYAKGLAAADAERDRLRKWVSHLGEYRHWAMANLVPYGSSVPVAPMAECIDSECRAIRAALAGPASPAAANVVERCGHRWPHNVFIVACHATKDEHGAGRTDHPWEPASPPTPAAPPAAAWCGFVGCVGPGAHRDTVRCEGGPACPPGHPDDPGCHQPAPEAPAAARCDTCSHDKHFGRVCDTLFPGTRRSCACARGIDAQPAAEAPTDVVDGLRKDADRDRTTVAEWDVTLPPPPPAGCKVMFGDEPCGRPPDDPLHGAGLLDQFDHPYQP